MLHQTLMLTDSLTMHALIRPSMVDPCFSIREIDTKLLRYGVKKKATPSAIATLNEQAARVKARQLMLSYATHLIEATKDEIRWLKDCGVLGKRAPKSSLMSATFVLSLLREQQKTTLAAYLQNALVHSKIGKWKTHAKVPISEADAAADAAIAAEIAAEEEATAARLAASRAALAAAAAADKKNGTYAGDSQDDQASAPAEPRPRSRRRPTASHKRKTGSDSDEEDDEEEDYTPTPRRKRARRPTTHVVAASAQAGYGEYTPAAASSAAAAVSHASLLASHPRPPPNMSVSKAVLMLNPKDRAAHGAGAALVSSVHFGADLTAMMRVLPSDPCTLIGPLRGSASARASHGITNGSWYIEVKGSEIAAQAMREAVSRADSASAASSSASSLLDQDAPPHCRLGFATSACPLDPKLLGHDEFSYAYGDRYGDKIHEGEAAEYGSSFAIFQIAEEQSVPLRAGDVIGMLIELGVPVRASSADTPVSSGGSSPTAPSTGNRISFYKNGECQGLAWSDLPSGHTWYPAVSLINGMAVTFHFQVNMAQAKPALTAASHHQLQHQQQQRFQADYDALHQQRQQLPVNGHPNSHAHSAASHQQHHPHSSSASASAYHQQPQQQQSHHLEHKHLQEIRQHQHHTQQLHQQQQQQQQQHPQPQPHSVHHSPRMVGSHGPQGQSAQFSPSSSSLRMQQLQQLQHSVQQQQQLVHQQQQQIMHNQAQQHPHQQAAPLRQPHQHPPQQQQQTSHARFSDSSPRVTGILQQPHHNGNMPPMQLADSYPAPQSVQPQHPQHPHAVQLHLGQPQRVSSSSTLSMPSPLSASASPGGYPQLISRQLRVPSTDDDASLSGALSSAIMQQPSPSPSPAFPLPLISPAASPTPMQGANLGTTSYSLSTTPLPMLDDNPPTHMLQYASAMAGSPMPSAADIL